MVCRACVTGHLHSGTPKGTVTKLHGLDVYIASPPAGTQPKGIVVYIPDAFGWEIPNNRLLADAYAEKGPFTVYLPDFMAGKSCPIEVMHALETMGEPVSIFRKLALVPGLLWNFLPFMISNRLSITLPRVTSFLTSLCTDPATSSSKIGVAGFCWGGKHVVLLCSGSHTVPDSTPPRPLIDAGFTAHPSQLSIPADVQAVRLPLSIAIGDDDMAMRIEAVRQAEAALRQLEEKQPEMKGKWEVRIYEGAKHGFSTRADEGDEKACERANEAGKQAVEWFQKWLA